MSVPSSVLQLSINVEVQTKATFPRRRCSPPGSEIRTAAAQLWLEKPCLMPSLCFISVKCRAAALPRAFNTLPRALCSLL